MTDNKIFNNIKDEFYEKYNSILLNLSDTKLVSRTMVNFQCQCGIIQNIQYRLIIKRGTYCRKCCYANSIKKRKVTVESMKKLAKIYNKLLKIEDKYKCSILNKSTANHNSIIEIICSCGANDTTLYRNIKIRGGYCRDCSYKHGHEKRTNTFMDKYGTTHPSLTPHMIEKTKKTNIERYGVAHPAQCPFIHSNTYKSKKYITNTGNEYIIQGYENIALDELLQTYSDNDIVIGKNVVPQIDYLFNNNKKIYFPDIYIPKENKLIEVKSTWTYKVQIDKNTCKANACKMLGYIYEFWIYDNKKNKKIINP